MRKPAEVWWEIAAALPTAATTAYRALALLGLGEGDHTGTTLVVDGASGGVGVLTVQVAVARGVTVIGTASESHQDDVRALGATPGGLRRGARRPRARRARRGRRPGLRHRGQGLAARPRRADRLPGRTITIADYAGAQELGVTFTSGGDPDERGAAP